MKDGERVDQDVVVVPPDTVLFLRAILLAEETRASSDALGIYVGARRDGTCRIMLHTDVVAVAMEGLLFDLLECLKVVISQRPRRELSCKHLFYGLFEG